MDLAIRQVVHARMHFPMSAQGSSGTHASCVLALHVRAQGTMRYGGEELVARPPYLVLFAAGERDERRLWGHFEGWWCLFDCAAVRCAAGARVAVAGSTTSVIGSHQRLLEPSQGRAARALFAELASHAEVHDMASQLLAAAKLHELIALWAGAAGPARPPATPLTRFRELIDTHALAPRLSLRDLARRAGGGVSHLGAAFRRAYGLTPVEYRTRLRLARARELLLTARSPMAEIATEAGFGDARYLARLFRRAFGTTPRTFARDHALNVL
jgi:AraC-like DNA-binding protein